MLFLVGTGTRLETRALAARIAILQSLGIDTLAIHSECDSTRAPADGVCACLTDIPGGYCYHTGCEVVGLPPVLEDEQYRITIAAREGAGRGR